MRRIRWRRVGKWAGAALVLFMLLGWAVSIRYELYLWVNNRFSLGFHRGSAYTRIWIASQPQPFESWTPSIGPHAQRNESSYTLASLVGVWKVDQSSSVTWLYAPIWAIAACLAVPTIVLWCLDRRRPPGSCAKCGYDLTGNTTGICPECGKARAADAAEQQSSR